MHIEIMKAELNITLCEKILWYFLLTVTEKRVQKFGKETKE